MRRQFITPKAQAVKLTTEFSSAARNDHFEPGTLEPDRVDLLCRLHPSCRSTAVSPITHGV